MLAACAPGCGREGGRVSELVSAARELHARGFHVFPCDHPNQRQCIGKHETCDLQRGKHPAVSWGTWAQTVTPQMIERAWEQRGGLANPAVSCGPSNLVIFDEDGAGALDEWCEAHGITLPATYIVTTGRGRHLYFRWDHDAQPIGNSPKVFGGRKIDVRGHGGYAIAEGARHASGATYTGNGLDVAELPAEVAEMLLAADGGGSTTDASASERFLAVDRANPIPEKIEMHTRHNALVAYAGRLRKSGIDYAEAEPAYRLRWLLCVQPVGQIPEAEHHDPDCAYPVTWDEALAKLRDVYRRYPAGQTLDEKVTPTPTAGADPAKRGRLTLAWASEIEDTVPTWAWEFDGRGRILNADLTLFAGRPQAGKSTCARWFAAGWTKGTLPGCFEGKPINVAYVAGEEAWQFMVKPSLRAAGADLNRVAWIKNDDNEQADIKAVADEVELTEMFLAGGVRAVFLDPLVSTVVDGKVDDYRSSEIRELLKPWQRIARAIDGPVVGIMHLTKSPHGDILASINGASAYGEVARCAFAFAPDREAGDGSHVMSQVKNNAGICDLNLVYRIGEKMVTTSDGNQADMGRFELIGTTDKSVRELIAAEKTAGSASATGQCERWLKGYLTEHGRSLKGDVVLEAGELGFSAKMLRTACGRLDVQFERMREVPPKVYWTLPDAS